MLTEERHSYILKKLKEEGIVKSQDIIRELNCSESTVRRDLILLEDAGHLKRIRGGAKRVYDLDEELSVVEKSAKNVQEKTLIARYAASFIKENDVIYLDAGTTTLAMIPFLNKNITVVTNGVQHASLLVDQQLRVYLLGGVVKNTTKAIVGVNSVSELKKYRFTKAFLGINGIDEEYGCTTPDPEEALLKYTAIQQSSNSYVLSDHSKWGKVNFAKVCDLDEVTIITDQIIHLKNHNIFENATILEAIS
ncbi:MAG: DeoR/GlpR family DNA-binding transcription regulator [Caldibacillus thermoamylovorans]